MSFDPNGAQIYVAGGYRTAPGARIQDVINPADLSVVGRIALCEARHVGLPLEAAQIAQRAWAALDAKSRAAALHRVADAMEANAQGLVAELMTREMGKPYTEAVGELLNVASIFRYYAEMARDDGGSWPARPRPARCNMPSISHTASRRTSCRTTSRSS